MRVVLAPDSFKGTATATDAARALADGWRSVRPHDELVLVPQADGGEGTLEAVAAAVPGAVVRDGDGARVAGPDGRPVPARWLALPDGIALVELAAVSGLPLMAALDPLGATTRGLGETIGLALDDGAHELWVALGGSASTDGGAGALAALGLRITDAAGDPIPDGGAALARAASVDRRDLRAAPLRGIRLLTDVDSPLLGPTGAAAVFGPQKGASPADVATLDAALAHWSAVLGVASDGRDAATPGAGAAGGTAYGFLAAWGATVAPGADAIAALTGLDAAIAGADVLITGEGRFDATSLVGKVVGRALGVASRSGTPAVIVAGRVDAHTLDLGAGAAGTPSAIALDALAGSPEAAMAEPLRWLEVAGAQAARGHAA